MSSTELKKLNLKRGTEKLNERDAKFATYQDRGTSGRAVGLKEATARLGDLRATYKGSKDLIERYGKDAPNARSFMAYEGQSGTAKKKGGGVVKMKEGSAKDMREDKAMAKKAGMTMKQHEASAADKKHDAPKKMAMGGTADPAVVARMTQGRPPVSTGAPTGSGSRRIAFEGPNDGMPGMRSGPPKPNMGPMPPRRPMGTPIAASTSSTPSTPTAVDPRSMKKGGGVEKKAKGGMVRGAGCAVRGKTGAKEY
jgi:hypothetical protein